MLEYDKEDIMRVFHALHEQGTFQKSHNATFIALTPKKTWCGGCEILLPC